MLIGPYESSIEPFQAGKYSVNPGCQKIFTVTVTDSVKFCVVQMNTERQDFSLRCHISVDPGDTSIDLVTPLVSFWGVRRSDIIKHELTTGSSSAGFIAIPVAAGTYHLNVLNLSNAHNDFAIITYST